MTGSETITVAKKISGWHWRNYETFLTVLHPHFFLIQRWKMEEAFLRLFNTFNAEKKLEIFLHFDDPVKICSLSPEMQLNLYRILQEQLRNIQKYASASIVEVDLLVHYHQLKLNITDNGIGFNKDKVMSGIGLANMKRRAELFSGKFEIHSSPGDGCEIIVDIALPEIK